MFLRITLDIASDCIKTSIVPVYLGILTAVNIPFRPDVKELP